MKNEYPALGISSFAPLRRSLLLLLSLTSATLVMANLTQQQKITSDPRGVGAQFGNAVALSGATLVVGARFDSTTASQAGAAFVYIYNGGAWIQQAKLLANDGALGDKFGYSVAVSGDTIVVGAYNDDSPLSNAGSAYVFVRSGTTWTQQQKLAGASLADHEFGNAVAITGETIAVGEHFSDLPSNSEAGAVYIFRRTGTTWAQTQKLIPVAGVGVVILGDHFGESLAITDTKLVVGAAGSDSPETAAGAVYVFAGVSGPLALEEKLFIASGKNGANFGFSVAIEGNTLVAGAHQYAPVVGQTAHGAAYVFEFNGTGWSSQGRLTASDGASNDNFGWSVGVSDGVVVVGSRGDDTAVGPDAGSAYVFTRSGSTWSEDQKIVPTDAFNSDRFGASVALHAGTLVVGAGEKALTTPNGQGAVYSFRERSTQSAFPDFDGDGKSDISLFSASTGIWWISRSSDGAVSPTVWGVSSDREAPADYDGDGKTDVAIFRNGDWYRSFSSDGHFDVVQFGVAGDLPMPADFDGDGRADIAIYRPTTGQWWISGSMGAVSALSFGVSSDLPLIGDFDGDGKADHCVFRPSTGTWYILPSSNLTYYTVAWGVSSDLPVPADYDGDGKTDVAVFRPANGSWYVLSSETGGFSAIPFGALGDLPVPADYDGDGRADFGIFRPDGANWFIQRTTAGILIQQFGVSSDHPIPLYFLRRVTAGPTITSQPLNKQVNVGASAAFSVAVTGSTALSYQWEQSDAGSSTWTTLTNGSGVTGATSATLTVTSSFAMNGRKFRVIVSDTSANTVTSSLATLLVIGVPPTDFNGDGKADILWRHGPTGEIGTWLMNGTTLSSYVVLGSVGADYHSAGAADIDGDGKTDVLWRHGPTGQVGAWLMNGTAVSSYVVIGTLANDYRICGTGDFNGDGDIDILLRHGSTGEVGAWLMSGSTVSSYTTLGSVSLDYVLSGAGDFNGDGHTDLLWRYRPTGEVGVWLMNRTVVSSYVALATVSSDYHISGVDDFDGNGKIDILWRNSSTGEVGVWLMNGTSISSYLAMGSNNGNYQIANTGESVRSAASDFDRDGKSDILWRNTATGGVVAWLMNGASVASYPSIGTAGLAYQIAGTGDINGDGNVDILWRHGPTSEIGVWLMNGTAVGSYVNLGTVSSDYTLSGTGDFNADGHTDIVWRHTPTGEVGVWLMNGTTVSSYQVIATASPQYALAGTGDFNRDGKVDLLWRHGPTGEVGTWLMNGTAVSSYVSIGVVDSTYVIAGTGDINGDGYVDILWRHSATGEVGAWLMTSSTTGTYVYIDSVPTVWEIAN